MSKVTHNAVNTVRTLIEASRSKSHNDGFPIASFLDWRGRRSSEVEGEVYSVTKGFCRGELRIRVLTPWGDFHDVHWCLSPGCLAQDVLDGLAEQPEWSARRYNSGLIAVYAPGF